MHITFEDLVPQTPQRGFKRSRAAGMDDEPMALSSDEDMVIKILGSSVPVMVMRSLRTLIREFTDKIEKLQRARMREQKQDSDPQMLLTGKYPAGVKPFSPGTEAELDSLFSESRLQDVHLDVVIPRGSTRKQALSIMHIQAATFNKKVDLEVTKDYIGTLQPLTTSWTLLGSRKMPTSKP